VPELSKPNVQGIGPEQEGQDRPTADPHLAPKGYGPLVMGVPPQGGLDSLQGGLPVSQPKVDLGHPHIPVGMVHLPLDGLPEVVQALFVLPKSEGQHVPIEGQGLRMVGVFPKDLLQVVPSRIKSLLLNSCLSLRDPVRQCPSHRIDLPTLPLSPSYGIPGVDAKPYGGLGTGATRFSPRRLSHSYFESRDPDSDF